MEDRSAWVSWGFRLALLAAVIAVLAVLGVRLGVMPLRLALFAGLGGGALIALIAALVSVIGLFLTFKNGTGGRGIAFAALFLSLAIVLPMGSAMRAGGSVPPIHDISTDLTDPPAFAAVRAQRTPAHNSLDRSQPENLGALQVAAYPDLSPIMIDKHPGEVFEAAVIVAQDMGWEIVSVAVEEGRIEATDTTFIMGFKDDIVIRVREEAGKALVDIRSASRVGESDLGKNAARIRALRERLTAQ